MVAHILCRVTVFSIVVFLHHLLEEFVINIDYLYNKFVQCLDYLSIKSDLVLHVFLESTLVHNYQSVVVPVSQY